MNMFSQFAPLGCRGCEDARADVSKMDAECAARHNARKSDPENGDSPTPVPAGEVRK